VGGAEQFLAYLLGALSPTIDATVIGASPTVVAMVAGPRVTAVVSPMSVLTVRKLLRSRSPDLLHANLSAFTSCRPAVLAALTLRLPVVLVDHLPAPGLSWRGRLLQRLMTRACSARVAVGEQSSRLVEHYGGLSPGTVLSIPNGVPGPATAIVHPTRDRPVLGTLCRLEQQKAVDVLLQALAGLPDVQLYVAGDGSQRAHLEALASQLQLNERVRFLGWVTNAYKFFQDIDVLVVPSRNEAMPLAVLEAMHASLPVIASRVGSLDEVVVDGGTGLLVEADDVAGLSSACRTLIEDPELRQRLGEAARARAVERFSDTAMAASYDALYRRVLGGRGDR
jgi:glycosyltransferase involved in cell wall biosynthesis